MNRNRGILLGLILSALIPVSAQECSISGTAPGYRAGIYPVYTILNPVTVDPEDCGNLTISPGNNFTAKLDITSGSWVFTDIGIYRMMLYVEPGFDYTVEVPPSMEMNDQQKLNPYFEPVVVHLLVTGKTRKNTGETSPAGEEINELCYRFDTLFFSMSERVLLKKRDGYPVNSRQVIDGFESDFINDSSVMFRRYRFYRYGLLELTAGTSGLGEVRELYLPDPVPRFTEPAYMELFNKMFDDFLVYYGRTEEGKELIPAVNRYHDLGMLRTILRRHPAIMTDTVADLVILKDLYTQFFKETFYRESIIMLLDSVALHPSLPEYGEMAAEIRTKLTRLVPGNEPPAFRLRGMDGAYHTLSDYRGKYVYLVFCTPENYSCMIEYPFLKSYHAKHNRYLEVVNIMVCDEYEQMTDFMKKNHYEWSSLFYGDQPGVLIDYDIRIFPVCYLIGPDGKLILSPAKLPSESFEQSLFRIMRSRGDI